MKEIGENFSTSGPENHGFSSLPQKVPSYEIVLPNDRWGLIIISFFSEFPENFTKLHIVNQNQFKIVWSHFHLKINTKIKAFLPK